MAVPAHHCRRRLVGMSTKMYFSAQQTKQYVQDLVVCLSGSSPGLAHKVDVFIVPDAVSLTTVLSHIQSANNIPVMVGAQDAFWEDTGAFTGELSPSVLSEVGCSIVELGHAERRRLFAETDAITAQKAAAAARNGLIPLVCIGEPSRVAASAAAAECAAQVEPVAAALPHHAELVLAYEPAWAIGAAHPAPVEHIVAVAAALRRLPCLRNRPGLTRIIYGGSAGPGMYDQLKDATDGLFLGRFAHDPEAFVRTIREVADA